MQYGNCRVVSIIQIEVVITRIVMSTGRDGSVNEGHRHESESIGTIRRSIDCNIWSFFVRTGKPVCIRSLAGRRLRGWIAGPRDGQHALAQ